MTDHDLDSDIVEPIDIAVDHQGSIVLLVPQTSRASGWMRDHLDESVQRWGRGFAVEQRYVLDILTGAVLDGLLVAPR